MNFNENEFRHLISETHTTITTLGTSAGVLIKKFQRFTEHLIEHLVLLDAPFNCDSYLQWVDSIEHDPPSKMSTSYIEWIAFRRFVILIEKQRSGTLDCWEHYPSQMPKRPESREFLGILEVYSVYLSDTGLHPNTISRYAVEARDLLLYLEQQGIPLISEIYNADICGYFASQKFCGRKPRGVQTTAGCLRKFLVFLMDRGYTEQKHLHHAVPCHRGHTEKIITIVTAEVEKDIMEDKPDSLVNLRDKAVLLLALHIGLRSCDIKNLCFGDINWEKGILTIQQQKTGAALQMPVDSKTQNAVIDYVLNERRECKSKYIFITAVGPAGKLARGSYHIKHRAKGTPSHDKILQNGLHILRRTYASRLLICGTPLPMISEMLGHRDKTSVQCYLSTDEAKMKRCGLGLSAIPYGGREL